MCSFARPRLIAEFVFESFESYNMAMRRDRPRALQDMADKRSATTNLLGDLLLTPDLAYAGGEPFPGLGRSHGPMSNTKGLPPSTLFTTGVDHGHSEDSDSMGEGEKLKKLLEIKRYDQVNLAKALGVTKTAVGKWTKETRFSDRVWPKVREGLIALGLNPADVRAGAQDQEASEDLTKLVERWSRDQLSVLRRILMSDEVSKSRLLAYIEGALRPHT